MKRYLLLALAVLATVGFCALGVWQLERREWKLALIDRVERRIHAEPVAPPGPADWTKVNRESSEYLRVTATGHFLPGRETRVYATTALGGGFWVMAPFQTDAGFIVLVNRGFVPLGSQSSVTGDTLGAARGEPPAQGGTTGSGARTDASEPSPSDASPPSPSDAGTPSIAEGDDAPRPTRVTGLVRMSEPGGAFLRANAPGENRWYSRDVEAIAQTQQLPSVAPYFIDAEAGGNGQVAPGARADLETPGAMASPNGGSVNRDGTGGGVPLSANGGTVGNGASAGGPLAADPGQPIPGLTVVTFRNSHLSYAITWFLLALLTAGFGVLVARTR